MAFLYSFFILAYPFEVPLSKQPLLKWHLPLLPKSQISVCVCVCRCVNYLFCFGKFVTVYVLVFPEVLMFASEIRNSHSKKMANFFLVHSRMVFHWRVQELSFLSSWFRLHLISPPCPSCLRLPCQSSVGGLLSSPSAPVPISGLEMPPTQLGNWWLAAVPDLIAGKAEGSMVMWCPEHHLLELLGGESSDAGSFSQLCSKLTHQRLDSWTGSSTFEPSVLIVGPDTTYSQMFVALIGFGAKLIFCCYHKI